MKFRPLNVLAVIVAARAVVAADVNTNFPATPPIEARSAAEELKTMQLPEGYSLELVLSEPDIKEPVAISFDGNGRMYVVEMRTYMQDIDGTGEHEPKSRISWHESSKRDGTFDRHGVFLDNVLLPRMVLPLDEKRTLVGLTDTSDIVTHFDTNGDGTADSNAVFYVGGPRGGNMEHQPSGLLWAMDNWIYTTYNSYRLRWTPAGTALKEPTAPNGGQWGLAQDDHGKPWWSNAGGEKGLWHFQTHVLYGAFDVAEQFSKDFMTVYPAIGYADVQGGPNRFRPEDKTLNHFTASCGQEVFRGDRLPADLRGDALVGEPVGRLIRRASVSVVDGITYLTNKYEKSEFIRSTDAYFRPLNMATAPDGTLYIVDMYRGIIQEGNWTRPNSYLRKPILQHGMDKIIGRGRIWRLVHKDFKPGPQPRMLDEKPAQLVAHLEHPNGWWRDTAQRLLVVRQDKSVVPALAAMARTSKNYLARMHALWTLEGLDAIDAAMLREKFKDEHPRVRAAALQISESLFKKGDTSLLADAQALATDPDANVVIQLLGTGKVLNWPNWSEQASAIIMQHPSRGVGLIGKQIISVEQPARGGAKRSKEENALIEKGQTIFKELCFACHGLDGKGMPLAGQAPGATMAPPLGGSRTVNSSPAAVPLVLLNGLAGPINGKTYEAQMLAMANNDDTWIAAISSFLRNSFGNTGSVVTPKEVAKLRKAVASRTTPWTTDELAKALPSAMPITADWKVTASLKSGEAKNAIDGKPNTRYDTGTSQTPGQWFQIELPAETPIAGITLDASGSKNDYPRGYKVELSNDGTTWSKPVATGKGDDANTEITFPPQKAKFIRITQTGSVNGLFWSIHELQLLRPGTLSLN